MEERVRHEIRRYAVSRAITCSVTGRVLDVRTAVLIESATDGRTLAVLSPDGWLRCREDLTKAHDSGLVALSVDNAPASAPFQPRG